MSLPRRLGRRVCSSYKPATETIVQAVTGRYYYRTRYYLLKLSSVGSCRDTGGNGCWTQTQHLCRQQLCQFTPIPGRFFMAPWNGTEYHNDNNILPLSEVFDQAERGLHAFRLATSAEAARVSVEGRADPGCGNLVLELKQRLSATPRGSAPSLRNGVHGYLRHSTSKMLVPLHAGDNET